MSLDLCRPFAAHCIGYPVVTLGFGFKSYVGYRIRQRKQREIAKENEFYMQLLQQALPKEEEPPVELEVTQDNAVTTATTTTTVTANNNSKPTQNHHNQKLLNGNGVSTDSSQTNGAISSSKHHQNHRKSTEKEKQSDINHFSELDSSSGSSIPNNIVNKSTSSSSNSNKSNNLNYNNLNSVKNNNNNNSYHQYGNGGNQTSVKDVNLQASTKCSPFKGKDLEQKEQNNHNNYSSSTSRKECDKDKFIKEETDKVKGYVEQEVIVAAAVAPVMEPTKERRGKQKDNHHNHQQYHQQQTNTHNHDNDKKQHQPCDQCHRLEQEAKKLKSEVQSMRGLEADWRGKLDSMKVCLQTKEKENEDVHKQLSVECF